MFFKLKGLMVWGYETGSNRVYLRYKFFIMLKSFLFF